MRSKILVGLVFALILSQFIDLIMFKIMDSSVTLKNTREWKAENLDRTKLEEKVIKCEELVNINQELVRDAIRIGKDSAIITLLLIFILSIQLWKKGVST